MPYIAFFDMLGTRTAATISHEEYKEAIEDFNAALHQVSLSCDCKIFGYSDNAYVEIRNSKDMVDFFRSLRKVLMGCHRYFSAYVAKGTLAYKRNDFSFERGQKKISRGSSMMFTESKTTEIFIKQCGFKGIGISLSDEVAFELGKDDICQSVFLSNADNDSLVAYQNYYDISYKEVSIEELQYIFSDYILATVMNKNAGRYYASPIISMIKSLDCDILIEKLDMLMELILFQKVPEINKLVNFHSCFPLLFIMALIDHILTIKTNRCYIDVYEICTRIIGQSTITKQEFFEKLPKIPLGVISNENKREFMRILYDIA